MKKGQLLSQPFTYIFAILVIALIFVFGFNLITKLKTTTCGVENVKFETELKNEIERVYSVGFGGSSNLCALVSRTGASDAPCEIIIPAGIEGLCIVDTTKPIAYNEIPFTSLSQDIKLLQGKTINNVFFASQEKGCKTEQLTPLKLENVDIKGPICAKSGKITKFVLENKGKTVEIRKAAS